MLAAVGLALSLLLLPSASAQPPAGPWIISDHQVLENETASVRGDVIIESGGVLEIRHGTLQMVGAGGIEPSVEIRDGGRLNLSGSPGQPASIEDGPNDDDAGLAGLTDHHWHLAVRAGGTFEGHGCRLDSLGPRYSPFSAPQVDRGASASIEGNLLLDTCSITNAKTALLLMSTKATIYSTQIEMARIHVEGGDVAFADVLMDGNGLTVRGALIQIRNLTAKGDGQYYGVTLDDISDDTILDGLDVSGFHACIHARDSQLKAQHITTQGCSEDLVLETSSFAASNIIFLSSNPPIGRAAVNLDDSNLILTHGTMTDLGLEGQSTALFQNISWNDGIKFDLSTREDFRSRLDVEWLVNVTVVDAVAGPLSDVVVKASALPGVCCAGFSPRHGRDLQEVTGAEGSVEFWIHAYSFTGSWEAYKQSWNFSTKGAWNAVILDEPRHDVRIQVPPATAAPRPESTPLPWALVAFAVIVAVVSRRR